MAELIESIKFFKQPIDNILLSVGKVVPSVKLQTLEGSSISISDFIGKPTVFSIISPGCEPCRNFVQTLVDNKATEIFLGKDFQHVLISTANKQQTLEIIQESFSNTLKILLDVDRNIASIWGVRSTPTFIWVGIDGEYLKHKSGYIP